MLDNKISNQDINNQRISDWTLEDRPREKLMMRGKEALTNAELLAIIIGSGSRSESAVALMQRVLIDNENNLNHLGRKSIEELVRYKGIGTAKAISLVAMLEIGRRRQSESAPQKTFVNSSDDAFNTIRWVLQDLQHEEFWVLLMNRANKLIRKVKISSGGIAATVVDPKILFKKALENNASSMILVHNHPSGSLKPSQQDIALTKQLITAGKVLEIFVHDHIIVGENKYYSFADEGQL